MAKFVPDIKTHRWVVISPQRIGRPQAQELGKKLKEPAKGGSASGGEICPFCQGNEKLTPPEVFRLGEGEPDQPGWEVRVIPNKFPITDIHEVIIHSPDHQKDIEELSFAWVEKIFRVYRQRYQTQQGNGQVLIFCNHGKGAGASLTHPHTQLVVVPGQINLDVVTLEPVNNLVKETDYFFAYCPDFSQWPYEVWLVPKSEIEDPRAEISKVGRKFGEITDQEIEGLVRLLQEILQKLARQFPDFNYNYYIFPGQNWYLRIIPRLVDRAGFELGTGLSVNIKDPTEASEELRD